MSENPLRSYFRRPTIYFKLPSNGKYYPPGVVNMPPNGELAVYPMTSADEMDVRTPDGLFNGASVIRVIKNCVPDIIDPWQLNDVDMEAVIIAIRAATVDGKLEIASACPNCNEESTYDVDLLRLLAEKSDVDYDTPLLLGDLEIKFRPLSYAQTNQNSLKQFEIQKFASIMDQQAEGEEKQKVLSEAMKRLNSMMTDIITQTIEYVKTPEAIVTEAGFIHEFLENCDSKTSKIIKEYSAEMRTKNETKPIKVTCIHCGHEYSQSLVLNFTDFFD